MKEKLKSALKPLVQLMSSAWSFTRKNAVPLMAVDSFVAVAVMASNGGSGERILALIWAAVQAILLCASGTEQKSERERFGKLQNVRRLTKRIPQGVTVRQEDIPQALALLADLEDYMGK